MAQDYRRLKTAALLNTSADAPNPSPKHKARVGRFAKRQIGPSLPGRDYSASHADVARLRTLRTLRSVELDVVAFFERFESSSLDRAEVHKQIFSAVIGSDEPESLCIVEPFHRTFCHF